MLPSTCDQPAVALDLEDGRSSHDKHMRKACEHLVSTVKSNRLSSVTRRRKLHTVEGKGLQSNENGDVARTKPPTSSSVQKNLDIHAFEVKSANSDIANPMISFP